MTEKFNGPNQDAMLGPVQDPSRFGPTVADTYAYSELLKLADTAPESLGFSPRANAELTASLIDRRSLTTDTLAETGEADEHRNSMIAQQRYIAGVLGLRVGETEIDARNVATASVSLPDAGHLPELPPRQPDGTFISPEDGRPMSAVKVDAIYAAHYIAANAQTFSRIPVPSDRPGEPDVPGFFQDLFGVVAESAERGQLEITDQLGNQRGACSMVRQVARVLGYKVGKFTKNAEGSFVMPIEGVEPGFDSK